MSLSRLLIFIVLIILVYSQERNVKVDLQTKFTRAPLVVEISEFFASKSNSDYWNFFEKLQTREHWIDNDMYTIAVDSLADYDIINLNFSMALSTASPIYNMYSQLLDNDARSIGVSIDKLDCSSFIILLKNSISCGISSWMSNPSDYPKFPDFKIYHFDHIYQTSEIYTDTIIVYADLLNPEFHQFYLLIKNLKNIRIVLRPFSASNILEKLELQGYGVELAIKNMEYKLLDDTDDNIDEEVVEIKELKGFTFDKLLNNYPQYSNEILKFKHHLVDQSKSTKEQKLKVWDISDLGFQASDIVLSSSDPLSMLVSVSQNFPSFASSLKNRHVNSTLKKRIIKNQDRFFNPGDDHLWINSLEYETNNLNIYSLHKSLSIESEVLSKLNFLNFSYPLIQSLLSIGIDDEPSDGTLDMRFDDILWINNIEKDKMYKSWSKSLNELLSFRQAPKLIRRNLYNCVLVVDPTSKRGLNLIKNIDKLINMQAPIRFGILPYYKLPHKMKRESHFDDTWNDILKYIPTNSVSIDTSNENYMQLILSRIFHYFYNELDKKFIFDFSTRLEKSFSDVLDIKTLKKTAKTFFSNEGLDLEVLESFYQKNHKIDQNIVNLNSFIVERGIEDSIPCFILNGQLTSISEGNLNNILYRQQMQVQMQLTSQFYMQQINENTDFDDYFYGNSVARYNQRLISNKLAPFPQSFDFIKYIYPPSYIDSIFDVSIWLLADFNTKDSGYLLDAAIDYIDNTENNIARITLIHYSQDSSKSTTLGDIVSRSPYCLSNTDSLKLIYQVSLITRYVPNTLHYDCISILLQEYGVDCLSTPRFNHYIDELTNSIDFDKPASGFMVVNGRIYSIESSWVKEIKSTDFSLVSSMANRVTENIIPLLSEIDHSNEWINEAILITSWVLFKRKTLFPNEQNMMTPRSNSKELIEAAKYTKYGIIQDNNISNFHVVAVINPIRKSTQTISNILLMFRDYFDFHITIFLNPSREITTFPLDRFYRFVFHPSISFDSSGMRILPESFAFFHALPTQHVYTLGIHTPESWLTEPISAIADLDNIRLLSDAKPQNTVFATFLLSHMLVFGQAKDPSGNPPAGLQIQIGENSNNIYDTVVMENLGYFQLKTSPGIWNIYIAESHKDIYSISPSSTSVQVIDFNQGYHELETYRQPGHENDELIDKSFSSDDSWFGSIFRGNTKQYLSLISNLGSSKKNDANETINVFSIASGHLYERLLKIMILSILRNTNSPVKFWFIQEFLSPRFKHQIYIMAEKFNFEVELINYKWPEWIRQQEQKMRRVWGMKILFLDVLFPLKVKKIIFVDADQVVRGNLKELVDMDLKGAPYGYTPFCDSNTATEGFRFWKSGYWKSHLGTKPYHISALYVVDLVKFRSMRAGDTLRRTYQQLSADPNSLSNLDQDLPNYAQHMLPIFSLPQEWLWCETWCSMTTLNTAKTIDLCNNPLTKEPKLEVAKRIIPEWIEFDELAGKIESEIDWIEPQPEHLSSYHTEL